MVSDKINFQLDGAAVPAGYTPDVGTAYSSGTGFGWVTQASAGGTNSVAFDITQYGRDRNRVDDQLLDTLLHMQIPNNAAAWEYEVPNGSYDVVVSVGDPRYSNSTHTINVEGAEVVAPFTPTTSQRHESGVATVIVNDGKLTVDAVGGNNTKINYIEFEPTSTEINEKINFQSSSAPVPEGYVPDSGGAYSSSRGYGWVTQASAGGTNSTPIDITQYGRDRNFTDDQLLDTLQHMQIPNNAAAWEYEVPNGSYDVIVSVGDPRYLNSTHTINVEGVEVVAPFTPTSSQRHDSGIATVTVNDGKLTVDAVGGNNTKINYIEIVEADPLPTEIDEKINFQSSSAPVPQGYLADSGEAYSSSRGYGWITQASAGSTNPTPIDITQYGRDRNRVGDQRVDTFQHMQAPNNAAAWEYELADGTYSVTVSVGDPSFGDSLHDINVEGVSLIDDFDPNNIQDFQIATTTVTVNDGRLTVDAIEGNNTKINYIEIESISSGEHPEVTNSTIESDSTGAYIDEAVTADIAVATEGAGVDAATLNTDSVQLYRTRDNALVPGEVNTTGGGDAIVYQPSVELDPRTNYTFRVTSDVEDEAGNSFLPYSTSFNTGTNRDLEPTPGVEFSQETVYEGAPISTLLVSPNGNRLYATGLDGSVRRWNIDGQGRLTGEQVFNDQNNDLQGRAIIGAAFNPDDLNEVYLWTTNNDPLFPQPAEDFTGKVSKIEIGGQSGSFIGVVEDYVVGLPRSAKDHLSNSLVFGPDEDPGAGVKRYLYMSQGSNTAMGAPDEAWYNRPERLLSGAVLKIDPDLTPPAGGFDVQTEDYNGTEGNYNPYAPDAPVEIFATGVRNAYDLVWHSNGNLYVPTNGSAAGGNTPDDPNTAADESLQNVATQNDYLFRIGPNGGGYYGHPNPERGEYILNGGNPTSGRDPAEVVAKDGYTGYPVGIDPEPNYQGFAYDFGRNRSPNGVIEYQSTPSEFGDALQGQILVVEYSGGDNVLALDPAANGNIGSATRTASGFVNPLDLIEDTANNSGNVYVAELLDDGQSGRITLLEPV